MALADYWFEGRQLTTKQAFRLFSSFERRGADECWPWMGYLNPDGYGVFDFGRGKLRGKLVHRVIYTLLRGPIPNGLCALHHCDNPPCVNPAHLFLGTQADNMADAFAKGRIPRGENNGRAKLTNERAVALKDLLTFTNVPRKELAEEFGIGLMTVSNIALCKTYRSVLADAGYV